VLRSGGRLAVFWNVFQTSPEATQAFAAVHDRVLPDATVTRFYHRAASALDGYSVMFAKAADGMRAAGAFGDPEQWRFDWEQSYTRDEWLDALPTQGAYTQLPPPTLAELLAGIGAAVDAMGGAVRVDYATVAVTAARASRQASGQMVQSIG
jgi:hypothetical protein